MATIHYSFEDIDANAVNEPEVGDYPRIFVVDLTWDGATAWNPASTNKVISGPARVVYTQFRDGGWQATVRPLP